MYALYVYAPDFVHGTDVFFYCFLDSIRLERHSIIIGHSYPPQVTGFGYDRRHGTMAVASLWMCC